MIKSIVKSALKPFWKPVRARIEQIISSQLGPPTRHLLLLDKKVVELQKIRDMNVQQFDSLKEQIHATRHMTYAPNPELEQSQPDSPFMQYSNCQASDFFHPRYIQLCKLIDQRPRLHRKQWEFIYVLHKLLEFDALQVGARGLVFGVGHEPLPAVFAAMDINVTATDAPLELAGTVLWANSNEYSSAVEGLIYPNIVPDDKLRKHVTHDFCDMNAIDPKFNNYDFNWSSCCFEHLGSIESGLQFMINAVENTLKVGGVAVHTTEYNVASDSDTLEAGDTVIFRHRDMVELVQRLRDRGHEVEAFHIGPAAHTLDFHVDAPPYSGDVHLKLQLASYVTTSVGLAVRRGK